MTKCLDNFINRRKDEWLARKIKEGKESELTLRLQADDRFSAKKWIENASLCANQLRVVSHVAKLSHPDAKTSAFIALCSQKNDGLVRSGNVKYDNDVCGNAAALYVSQFLSLTLENGMKVLDAFENRASVLVQYILGLGLDFEVIRENFLKIKGDHSEPQTSHLLKQVYFPIGSENYHLLSIINPMGLMQELNKRIKNMRQQGRECREKIKNNEIEKADFQRLTGLTKIGYGGSKPQNISLINNKEHGEFFLLPSLPPKLSEKYIHLPTEDFFRQSLNYRQAVFRDYFLALDKRWNSSLNNVQNRNIIRYYIDQIVDHILLIAAQFQVLPAGWSQSLENLPNYQKIWLDSAFKDKRKDGEWRAVLAERMASWIVFSWERIAQKSKFGDEQIKELQRLIESEKEIF